jgi:ubiquinone/menaquinone biosynthesis C-methylase UbiE
MKFYNKYILPQLTHWICSQNDITRVREEYVPLAKGRILEVGIGSGLNLPHYDPLIVDKVWGLDPSSELIKRAKKQANQMPFEVELIERSCEEIPMDDNSMDSVLVTYSLCSIPDVSKALNEINRILKPGGELIFCEHGRAPDNVISKWQDRVTPSWTKVSGGCHLNRDISKLINKSRFKIVKFDEQYSSPVKLISFNYRGIAIPS